MRYLLDANVFIQAKNLHYGLDFCPAFWDWLIANNKSGQVYSIDKIADEIAAGGDELTDWIQQVGSSLFVNTDARIGEHLGVVSNWVIQQNYEPAAVNTFLQVADFYLVAHALMNQDVVVTHEVPVNSTKRIKIPNVCLELGVRCMTPYQMLRRERARFILGKSA